MIFMFARLASNLRSDLAFSVGATGFEPVALACKTSYYGRWAWPGVASASDDCGWTWLGVA